MMIPYGDYINNTGLIDAISVSPEGVVQTWYENFDTEQIDLWKTFSDDSVWAAALDPKFNGVAQLLTNSGRSYHPVDCQPPGKPNAVHIYDLIQEPNGEIYAAGARVDDVAMVWKSVDNAENWTEDLINLGPANGGNRFTKIEHNVQNQMMVRRTDGVEGYWTHVNGAWVYSAGFLPALRVEKLTLTNVSNEFDRLVTRVSLLGTGVICDLPLEPGWYWTAAQAPDGSFWFSNQVDIFRMP